MRGKPKPISSLLIKCDGWNNLIWRVFFFFFKSYLWRHQMGKTDMIEVWASILLLTHSLHMIIRPVTCLDETRCQKDWMFSMSEYELFENQQKQPRSSKSKKKCVENVKDSERISRRYTSLVKISKQSLLFTTSHRAESKSALLLKVINELGIQPSPLSVASLQLLPAVAFLFPANKKKCTWC